MERAGADSSARVRTFACRQSLACALELRLVIRDIAPAALGDLYTRAPRSLLA